MPSGRKCSSQSAAFGSAPTFSAVAATLPAPTSASISALARQPKSINSRFAGPAVPPRKSSSPKLTAFLPWSKAEESHALDPEAQDPGTSHQSSSLSVVTSATLIPEFIRLVPPATQRLLCALIHREEMRTSGFVLNHLAGNVGMTPRGIDSPVLLRKTPPQRSRAVEVFLFLLSLKQFGSSHEISFALPARLLWWN